MIFDSILEREKNWSSTLYTIVFVIVFFGRYIFGRKLSMISVRMDSKQQEGGLVDNNHLNKPYEKVRPEFDSEYDRANPVTSEEKTKEYVKWIYSKLFFL